MFITYDAKIRIEYEGTTVHVKYIPFGANQVHKTIASGETLIVTVTDVLVDASEGIEAAVEGAMALEGKGGTDG